MPAAAHDTRPDGSLPAVLSGWGANERVNCFVRRPEFPSDVLRQLNHKGSVARGLGRSYGDAATNRHRQVLNMVGIDRLLAFDEGTGVLTCEAGVSLEQIIASFVPRGWFPMITPGTKFVTVGGCIASDVHGKAHHVHGCFSNSLHQMSLLLADGEVIEASREKNTDLFWATCGGMGQLGVILTATIQLSKIETTYFRQRSIPVPHLEALLETLNEHDKDYPYSVATIDVFAKGKSLGRGVVTVGDHARREELPAKLSQTPLVVSSPPVLNVPFTLPELTLNPLSMRLVNGAIQQIQKRAGGFGHYEDFFYPLDKIANWNRGYGKRGFTQYQFVVPAEDGVKQMRGILETIISSGQLPFLNVLKRLGEENQAMLSFPREGYTFAIDFPVRAGTRGLIQRLDHMVVEAGGRTYLAKDSFTTSASMRAMYPRLDEWLAIKSRYDPHEVFTSDLGRRVGLSR